MFLEVARFERARKRIGNYGSDVWSSSKLGRSLRPEPGGGGRNAEAKKPCSLCKERVVREGCCITDDFNIITEPVPGKCSVSICPLQSTSLWKEVFLPEVP